MTTDPQPTKAMTMTKEAISAAQIETRDPLAGFSPDDIVVGPGGETLAESALAESSSEDSGPPLAVRVACDIANGATQDPTSDAIDVKGAWRDLNAKGNGSETYRRALSPGGQWRFVSSERLPRGTFLSGDRKAIVRGDVFAGDLVADYDRALSHGKSCGEARHDGKVGLVIGRADKGAEIEWCDVARQKNGTWRVILPTGAHLTIPAAGWR